MIKGKEKETELTFKSRQMVKVGEVIGNQLTLETDAFEGNIKTLAKLISILSDSLDYDKALEVIDDYLDGGKSITELYGEVFAGINQKAFFTTPLTVQDSPPMDMVKIQKQVQEKIGQEMAQQIAMSQITGNM